MCPRRTRSSEQNNDVADCSACKTQFSLFNRKHHCRECHGVYRCLLGTKYEGGSDSCRQLSQPKMTSKRPGNVQPVCSCTWSRRTATARARKLSALVLQVDSIDDYWCDTCDALGVDIEDGLGVKELEGLYLGDGAWAGNLAGDYAAVFDVDKVQSVQEQRGQEVTVEDGTDIDNSGDESPMVEISVTKSNDVVESEIVARAQNTDEAQARFIGKPLQECQQPQRSVRQLRRRVRGRAVWHEGRDC